MSNSRSPAPIRRWVSVSLALFVAVSCTPSVPPADPPDYAAVAWRVFWKP